MKFLYGEDILRTIRQLTRSSKPLKIAVAYWGEDGIEETGLKDRVQKDAANIEIICDLTSGACNPIPIEALRDSSVVVKSCDGMHAKVWISGNNVVVGSANVSTNGLGFDSVESKKHNIEAAVHISDRDFARTATKWFKDIYQGNNSNVVTDEQIAFARERWTYRQKSPDRNRIKGNSILDESEQYLNGRTFQNVRIMAWRPSEKDVYKTTQKFFEKESLQFYRHNHVEDGSKLDFYSHEPGHTFKFSAGDIFLDFTVKPHGKKFSFNGIFRILSSQFHKEHQGSREKILIYHIEDNCKGHIISGSDSEKIAAVLEEEVKQGGLNEDDYGVFYDGNIADFMNFMKVNETR